MDPSTNLPWLILFLPLVAAAVITLFTQRIPRLSAFLSIGAIAISFLITLSLASVFTGGQPIRVSANWLNVGDLMIPFGLQIDRLAWVMLVVVTGVGSLIHIYSYGYMHDDPGFSRYFASLSLFTFSMLGIVLANNFFQMFIFWELVGVSSYLLIGFWYNRHSAADAARKAFLTNRIGDFGFLLGILIVWSALGTLQFTTLQQTISSNPGALGTMATIAGLLIFCGAMGKSAQFPLHVWLPDAMEGPTPVSALIHAATMVAAGVYMLCRTFFLFQATQAWPAALSFLNGITALDIIAWIGAITSLMAALIAVQQSDIKRILAYSTLSQLGYMVMTVGLSGPNPAMYHLTTHAFFKALLFLGAGSVIHALHHEQDIWNMGGLRRKMPVTFWTFLLGTLAIAGIPPLSGFFSKDAILLQAYQQSGPLFFVAAFVAVLTSFYMFRLFFVAFTGAPRSEASGHTHESPKVMILPLIILAIPTIAAGFFGLDEVVSKSHDAHHGSGIFAVLNHAPAIVIASIGAALLGLLMAAGLYYNAKRDPVAENMGVAARAMKGRFYFDEIYAGIIALTQGLAARLADWADRWIIGGLAVKGTHGIVELFGRGLRLFQTGNIQTYAFLIIAGAAAVLYYVFRP
ncbi:MAG TPA: NADH-quinone oxidoreductase subunit L [Methylomirabilota bacterium]|nr:NADH-quinone oxidoreductase subunit L [Methylomirabilota bacterium]